MWLNSIEKFKEKFPNKHSLITAIHGKDIAQILENIKISMENWASGCFVVLHHPHIMNHKQFLNLMPIIKKDFKNFWIWINTLTNPFVTFDAIKDYDIDWVREDCPSIKEINNLDFGNQIARIQNNNNWNWLYFGWVMFKWQMKISDEKLPNACLAWMNFLDVITTSWVGTGISADSSQIQKIRKIIWDQFPLALASWVTSSNVRNYLELDGVKWPDAFIVATGINYENDFFNIDHKKCSELSAILQDYSK